VGNIRRCDLRWMIKPTGMSSDRYSTLAELAALRDEGLLTDAEFESEKARLLAAPAEPVTAAERRTSPDHRLPRKAVVVTLVVLGTLAVVAVVGLFTVGAIFAAEPVTASVVEDMILSDAGTLNNDVSCEPTDDPYEFSCRITGTRDGSSATWSVTADETGWERS
jgi:hypothetical protein